MEIAAGKEIAEVAAPKISDALAEAIADLPEQLGELDGLDDLPDEIGEEVGNEQPQEKSVKGSPIGGGGFEVPRDGALDTLKQQGENVGGVEVPKKDISDIPKLQEGGAYKNLPNVEGKQRHHIPADSTTELPYGDGPCILMDANDHKQTASYDNIPGSKEYREKQKELIEQGKFGEAQQMDIDDIHEKFGDKYDKPIAEAQEYYKKLKEEGRIQ